MEVSSYFYDIIYHKNVNFLLRNCSFIFAPLLKDKHKIPPAGVLNMKTKNGRIKMATNQTSYLTKLVFWEGYKSFEYSIIFEKLANKVGVFLDIGANIGYYSLLAAKANPSIDIYAFEPAKGPKYYLEKNITINNFNSRIHMVELALSDQNGIIDFYEVESTKYNSRIFNLSGEHNAGTKKTSRNFVKNSVKSITLKDFIISEKLSRIDLIKIDTEGTEVAILNSGKQYIKEFQPIIICETLFNTTEKELQEFFADMDYEFYNYSPLGLVKVNSIERTNDNGIRNCFFVPISKSNLIVEFIKQ